MYMMIVGSALALSSLFLMQKSDSLTIYAGMLMLIVGLFLIKKGRDKISQKS